MQSILCRAYLGLALAGLVFGSHLAAAAEYPTKPVTIIVPQAPGGTSDIIADMWRRNSPKGLVSSSLWIIGQEGGNIGTRPAKGHNDGYTLLITISSTQAIS